MRRVKSVKKKSFKLRIIISVLILLGIGGFFVSPYGQKVVMSIKQGYHSVVDKAHLVVDQVEVEGCGYTTKQEIIKALNVAQGISIFDVDLVKSRENLLALPWVRTAVIERHLPSTLFIKITEKEVLAVWQNNGKYFPLDTNGKIIRDGGKTRLQNSMLIVGKDADKHALKLKEILQKYPEILSRLKSASRVRNRRWDLYLDDVSNGLIIELPDTQIEEALSELMRRNEKENLFQKNLKVIDLRVPNQVVVRLKEGQK